MRGQRRGLSMPVVMGRALPMRAYAVALSLAALTSPRDAAAARITCNDSNPCTSDAVVNNQCTYTPRPSGTSCADADRCNGTEACNGAGVCVRTPLVLDDNNPCTVDACTTKKGVTHTPVAAGTSCSDGNVCNGTETCNSTGVCVASAPPVLNDNNACTADSCDPATGVKHTPVAAGTSCSDGNVCNGTETCNAFGACVSAGAPTLDDGNPCTVDACSASGGVTHTPVATGTSCSDGNPCNGSETCSASGTCAAGAAPNLDDGKACTVDACSPTGGITHVNAVGGTPCPDGNLCNGDELCDGVGACLPGTPVPVGDENACTVDTCDPKLGVLHQPASPECASAAATWSLVVAGRPSARDSAAVAYDAVSKRAILFGGESGGVALADTWAWDGNGWRMAAYLAGPSARAAAAMVYDADRQKMVLFGGMSRASADDTYFNETWELDLATTTWTRRVPTTSPSARAMAAVGYDSARKRVVLFGGVGGTGDLQDTWEWDGTNWVSRTTTGTPPRRAGAAFAYHATRGALTLAGGARFAIGTWGTTLGDVWDYDGTNATWTERTADPRPGPRSGAAMSVAPTGAFFFGGTAPTSYNQSDAFRLDSFGAWHPETVAVSPAGRAGHALVFDSVRVRHVLFGGVSYSATGVHTRGFDDVWEYEPTAAAWTPRTPDITPALTKPGMAYDAARRVFVVRGDDPRVTTWELDAAQPRWVARESLADAAAYGAAYRGASEMGASSMFYDPMRKVTMLLTREDYPRPPSLWEWDGATWTKRTCTGGTGGLFHSSVTFDPVRRRIVAFGGMVSTYFGDQLVPATSELDVATCTWTHVGSSVMPPLRRFGRFVWDTKRNVGVLFGGLGDFGSALNDTWEWTGATWVAKSPATKPSARGGSSMAFDALRGTTVLVGGYASSTYLDELWEYDGTTWASRVTTGGPSARENASLAFDPDRGRIVLAGGRFANGKRAVDLWEWDGTAWERRKSGVVPSARSGAAGGYVPHRSVGVLFGGVRGDGARSYLQDTWIWNDGEWATASTGDPPVKYGHFEDRAPSPRAGHAFAVGYRAAGATKGAGLLFGGEGEGGVLGDTWTWDDETYRWDEWSLQTYGVRVPPSARSEHALAVNVDVGYLLFGGEDAAGALKNDTWNWSPTGGWVERSGSGEAPPARRSHAMVADTVRRKILLFGGRGANGALRDMWEWDMAAGSSVLGWTKKTPTIVPPAMFGHRMVYDPARAKIVLTGGSGDDPNVTYGSTWEWDTATGNWSLREPVTHLEPRVGHVAFFDQARNETLVVGGFAYRHGGTSSVTYGDVWSFARATAADAATAKYPNGTPCSSTASCASGACVDGYCCNSACTGQCGACDVPGSIGQCVPVSGAPHGGRANCTTSNLCGPRCDGKDLLACHSLSSGQTCVTQSCSAGMKTSSATCSSTGTCGATTTTSCAPYGCNGTTCATSCKTDGDCFSSAYFCAGASQFVPGTCKARAQLSSFTSSPSAPRVASPLTMTASASAGGATVSYRFSYSFDGTSTEVCPYSLPSTCSFTPSASGAYRLRVEVLADGAMFTPYHDFRELDVTVSP